MHEHSYAFGQTEHVGGGPVLAFPLLTACFSPCISRFVEKAPAFRIWAGRDEIERSPLIPILVIPILRALTVG